MLQEPQRFKRLYSSTLTLWQKQTPQATAEMARPHPETSLSPRHVGNTFQSDMNSTKGQADVTNLAKTQFCGADPTDLLQTRAQVAAENVADPVYFHTMDAGLCIAFLHPLQVGLLLVTKLSEIKGSFYSGLLRMTRKATALGYV